MAKNFYYPPNQVQGPGVLPSGSATAANQVLEIAELTDINANTANLITDLNDINTNTVGIQSILGDRLSGSLVPAAYDEIALTYVSGGPADGQISTATYSLASVQVKLLTLGYDGFGRLNSVVAS